MLTSGSSALAETVVGVQIKLCAVEAFGCAAGGQVLRAILIVTNVRRLGADWAALNTKAKGKTW